MQDPREKVGDGFDESKLLQAQNKTWQAIRKVAEQVRPGMTEKEALALLNSTLKAMGSEKIWHPPQIRFGVNTTCAFAERGQADYVLKEEDLFFFDIGPVFEGYEGDAGETFVVGSDPDMRQMVQDSKTLFSKVKNHWLETGQSGQELYDFARAEAQKLGWLLSLKGASGHRVSEFPHAVHHRGKLNSFDQKPTPNRWILEIHIHHPTKPMGAFFEDLL